MAWISPEQAVIQKRERELKGKKKKEREGERERGGEREREEGTWEEGRKPSPGLVGVNVH